MSACGPLARLINATSRVNVRAVSTSLFSAGGPTNTDIPRQIRIGFEFGY